MQLVIDKSGWRSASWALGILVLVVLVPLNLLLHKRPEDIGLRPDGEAAPTAATVPPPSNVVDPAWVAVDWTLGLCAAHRAVLVDFVGYFCGLYVCTPCRCTRQSIWSRSGSARPPRRGRSAFVSLIGIPGQIALGYLSDRIGREWIWTISSLGFAICFASLIALQYTPTLLLVYVMVAVQGFLGYGFTSIMGAVVAEIFQGKHFGTIFGTIGFTALAGGAAGPWVTGVLHDIYGDLYRRLCHRHCRERPVCHLNLLAAPRNVRAVAGRMHRIAKTA